MRKLIMLLSFILFPLGASALSLSEFFSQVERDNKEILGTQKQKESAQGKFEESHLLYSPQLFIEGRFLSDEKLGNPPMLTYDRLNAQTFVGGLSKQFSFGLQTKLYYQLEHNHYVNSPQLTGAKGNFYDARPIFEFTLPILKNGFGRGAEDQATLIKQGANAEKYSALALNKLRRNDAENAYWSLVGTREILRIQSEALTHAEDILNYVKKKARMKLGDESDVLQAESLVSSRRLELNRSQNDEKIARISFNSSRGINSEEVLDELDGIPYHELLNSSLPEKRPGDRYDLLVAEAQLEINLVNARLITERNRPNLDIYGSYAMNGRGTSYADASTNFSKSERDTKVIGFKFSVPLDASSLVDVFSGSKSAQEAQKLLYEQKKLDQDRDYLSLRNRFESSKASLQLAQKLVDSQTKKLQTEEERLRIGRTTTYQVLLFAQDQSLAELSKVQIALGLLNIKTAAKLYDTEK